MSSSPSSPLPAISHSSWSHQSGFLAQHEGWLGAWAPGSSHISELHLRTRRKKKEVQFCLY